jgi:wobble nucleotide-excising tRNase
MRGDRLCGVAEPHTMLKKFIAVRSVGRFINSAHIGVQECLNTTLVLGGNGFGKTTLASILRSNATDDPAIIIGRARLGAATAPEVELLLEGGKVTFRNGAWNVSASEFLVFEGAFIAENVHAGDVVDLEQRRNLYRVIVGKEGVGLAVEEERLATESRGKSSEINATEKAIKSHILAGMKLEDFIALPAEPDVDAKIATQIKAIDAVRAAAQLKARAGLNPMRLPDLPADFEAMLGKTLKGIAEDAQRTVADHIAHHSMKSGGEEWLQEGAGYIADGKCPYCGQGLNGLALVKAYQQVFADTYEELKTSAVEIRKAIERDFGDRTTGAIDTLVEANKGAIEFWSRYCKLPELDPPRDVAPAISALAAAALARLTTKIAAPQEAVSTNAAFGKALVQFEAARASVNAYSAAVNTANAEIAAKKVAVAAGDLKKEEAELARLNVQGKRQDPTVAALCKEHQRLIKQKATLDEQKAKVREKLEAHAKRVMKPYEGRINQLLDNFNAGFSIAQTKPAYGGGVASSTYQLVINDTDVNLGDGKTPTDQPSFKNTLSAGDRSTLALALFFAHLERDPDRAKRIVVFDDPFTSQDAFCRRQTVHEIVRAGQSSRQLIVFSHDASFLRQIRDKCKAGECIALQLGDHRALGIKIMPCDLDEACRGRAASEMDDLQAYVATGAGKDRDMIRKMRIILETYCRSTYPGSFVPDDRLGGMVEKIKRAGDQHPAWALADELEQINEYSRDHHHGEDPEDGSSDFIDGQELTGYIKRTLRVANNLQA